MRRSSLTAALLTLVLVFAGLARIQHRQTNHHAAGREAWRQLQPGNHDRRHAVPLRVRRAKTPRERFRPISTPK